MFIQSSFSMKAIQQPVYFGLIFCLFVLQFYVSPKLTIVALSVVPPVFIVAIAYGRYIRRISKKVQDSLADSTQVSGQHVNKVPMSCGGLSLHQGIMSVFCTGRRRKISKSSHYQGVCSRTKRTREVQSEDH